MVVVINIQGKASTISQRDRVRRIQHAQQGMCHVKRHSKTWNHFFWKGKLSEAQCSQHNKLVIGIGNANQVLVFAFPSKHKNQSV